MKIDWHSFDGFTNVEDGMHEQEDAISVYIIADL